MHILTSENRQQILEEVFNVTCPLQRESIIYRMKSLCENCDFEKASKIENSQGDAILRNIRTLLMREASVQIPKYPLRMLAGQLPNIEEWKTFMNSIAMWAGIESSGYARLVQSVHEDPSHEVDAELYVKFSEAQHHIDQRLGLWLYETCPESMKKYMIRREQFEIIEGQVSGLKILTVLGRKINMKAPYRRSELINKLLSRTPLEHVVDLENELIDIQRLVDEMERQGLQCDAQLLYMTLLKSISVLMGKISAPLHEVL